MDVTKTDIKELTNNSEINEAAIQMAYEAFPESIINYLLNDSFNKQLNDAPMLVLVYCAAVSAYAKNNNITDAPKDFPDLIKLWNDKSEKALYFQAQVNSANKEYSLNSDISGGAGLKRLLQNVNDGYKKNPNSEHIKMIANYGLEWNAKPTETPIIEQPLTQIDFNNSLTIMAAENYGEFIADNYVFFNELMYHPALTIAMAEYTQIFKHQKPQQSAPSLKDMLDNPNIKILEKAIESPKNLADKIPAILKEADPYDALPALLNEVRENPQNFFTNEGFINTTKYDKMSLAIQEKTRLGDYINDK